MYETVTKIAILFFSSVYPRVNSGFKMIIDPAYPNVHRIGDLDFAVFRNNRKQVCLCWCLDGHSKEPYELSIAWEPDRWSYFFFSPHAHLCAVTCTTEISLIVTLNKQHTHSLSSVYLIMFLRIVKCYSYKHTIIIISCNE